MNQHLYLVGLLALLSALGGCSNCCDLTGGSPPDASAPADNPSASAGNQNAAANWGDIQGRVIWAGDTIPKNAEANVDQDQTHCLSKGKIFKEEYVINDKNKGLCWCVVYLLPKEEGGKLPIHPDLEKIKDKDVVMDQPCCKFEPHVVALRQGQNLVVKNSAPVPHNVKWQGVRPTQSGNQTVAPGKQHVIDDLKASPFALKLECNIHRWMSANAYVFNHPYFAVTDEDGKFEIKNAPAGDYRLMVWQEGLGWKNRDGDPITIKAGKNDDLKMEMKPKKE
jgi:hypothetical protein